MRHLIDTTATDTMEILTYSDGSRDFFYADERTAHQVAEYGASMGVSVSLVAFDPERHRFGYGFTAREV